MSRTLAGWILGYARLLTLGQNRRRKVMTYALAIQRLEEESAHVIETRHGPIRVLATRGSDLAAAALGFHEEEPETLAWIDGFAAGETLWDVGAATGLFSIYAARRGIAVVAFEPKGPNYGVLIEHLALNGMGKQVTPLCIALSDKTGLASMTLASMAAGTGGNSVGGAPNQFGLVHNVFEQPVLTWRLDELLKAHGIAPPDHLKIDVDGAEGLILAGAPQTLKRVKSVLVEVEGENAAEAATRIEPHVFAAGLKEVEAIRTEGSQRNRLYVRA